MSTPLTEEEQARRYGIVIVPLSPTERVLIDMHARKASVGGHSWLFDEYTKREQELYENQLVGMSCEAAFAKWLGEFHVFIERRTERNAHPKDGDGGYDHVLADGRKVDVKGSEANGTLSIQSARGLCLTHVPRNTVLDDVVYVLGVTKRSADTEMPVPEKVFLVGWLYGSELRGREANAALRGWSVLGGSLHRMAELRSK